MSELQSESNDSRGWTWKSVLEDSYNDLFGVYLSYCLPDEHEVKKSFKNVLDSLRKIKFCDKCGKVHRETYKDNLFARGFTVCGRIPEHIPLLDPYTIAPQLRKFCEIYGPLPDTVSRVEITKMICRYIKDNKLYDPTDRRLITPDEKLSNLIGTKEQINYFNLQAYLVPLYGKRYRGNDQTCYIYRMFLSRNVWTVSHE